RLPRRRRGQRDSTSQDIVTAVRQLVLIANDDLIAGILNRNKLTTGRGNRWTRERVTALRSHHKIPVYCPPEQGQEPWLNLARPQRICRSVPRRCAWPPSAEKSTRYTPCRTDLGSSAALSSTAPRRKRWPIAPGIVQNTPRDRILINKIFSLQRHREMGVMKR